MSYKIGPGYYTKDICTTMYSSYLQESLAGFISEKGLHIFQGSDFLDQYVFVKDFHK